MVRGGANGNVLTTINVCMTINVLTTIDVLLTINVFMAINVQFRSRGCANGNGIVEDITYS